MKLCKALLIGFLLGASMAGAQELEFTNDFFAPNGQDRWLTNKIEVTHGQWKIGQEMCTPKDKRNAAIPEGDRPWDGYSYIGYTIENEGKDQYSLTGQLGFIGAASKAKRVQKFIHNDLGFGTDPKGWDTANDSSIAVDVYFTRKQETERFHSYLFLSGKLNTEYGLRVGNVVNSIFAKTTITRRIEKAGFAFEVHGGIEGRLVAFNTFLDGRIFRGHNKYTVQSIPFVAGANAGIKALHMSSGYYVLYEYRFLTEEFEGQEGRHLLGTIRLGKSF